MSCAGYQRQLGAYLDGELSDQQASAMRGHLRTCDACRTAAAAESKLLESLRQLPPLDPPPALWQAIRGQLAQEEIADARSPWHLRLWRRAAPFAPHAGGGVLAAAVALTLLWWSGAPPAPGQGPGPSVAPTPVASAVASMATAEAAPPSGVKDVSQALADEVTLADQSYDKAVVELVELVASERAGWSPAYARRYEDRVKVLRARVDGLVAGVEKERAWQELMRYLQTSLTRAELAMGEP